MTHHIARNGQQLGVYAEEEIQPGLITGRFLPDDLFWTEGMAEWQPLSTRFAVSVATPAFAAAASAAPAFNPYAAPQANVVTPAMLPQLNLASRGSRFGAALLDGLVGLLVVGLPLIAGIAMADTKADDPGDAFATGSFVCFGIAGLGFLGLTIYNIVLLTTRGQTIAKKWLGIRIVTHPDAQSPGFVKGFLLRSFVNGIIGQFVPLYGIVDACFIFREDQRCLHDLIADTTVITDNPKN
ncbi:MAG: RDD family protein [Prosthecobacter sp.]|uniref:RDD family protein n=1 Tax=Prosthecobacter sp. TaxID=1965333 RepID=UPI0019DFB51D|nr:RDD family protein [Prosthecobacter sp.]MBE2287292.1 RDD family protein [Prosthecobacter sp.]